jgi:hypothetical protein
MSSHFNILDSLTEDFLRNAPYVEPEIDLIDRQGPGGSSANGASRADRGDARAAKNDGDFLLPLSSWHDALRKHTAEMPTMPRISDVSVSERHSILGDKSTARTSGPHTSSGSRIGSRDHAADSLEQRKKELKQIKYDNLMKAKETYHLANLCKAGWNLSKGFDAKPSTHKPTDLSVVQKDIEMFASNLNRKKAVTYADRFPLPKTSPVKGKGVACISFGSSDLDLARESDSSKLQAQVKLSLNASNPGSRYDIRQFSEAARGSSPSTNFLQKQRSETLAKDFQFSKVSF